MLGEIASKDFILSVVPQKDYKPRTLFYFLTVKIKTLVQLGG